MSIEFPRDWSHQITLNLTDLAQLKEHQPAHLTTTLMDVLRTHHPGTYKHCQSVYTIGTALAEKLGFIPSEFADMFLLHDIGKLFVPQHLLSRTTNDHLTGSNLRLYREHPRLSTEILKYLGYSDSLGQIIRLHHADFVTMQADLSLRTQGICLPSLLRLADCTAAALDFDRPYQETPTTVGVLTNIRSKIDDVRIQKRLDGVWCEYMRELNFPNFEKLAIS